MKTAEAEILESKLDEALEELWKGSPGKLDKLIDPTEKENVQIGTVLMELIEALSYDSVYN